MPYQSDNDSGEELFNEHDTIATVPLPNVAVPLQQADRSPSPVNIPRSSPPVQVAASSPTTKSPSRVPASGGPSNGGLNRMAPPGTAFRSPWSGVDSQRQSTQVQEDVHSEDELGSSPVALEEESRRSGYLKPSVFAREGRPSAHPTLLVEESPKSGLDLQRYRFGEISSPNKRPADDMASAYASSRRPLKAPRQDGPARAQPAAVDDMKLADISDWSIRQKVQEMRLIYDKPISVCFRALQRKRGNVTDAIELISQEEARASAETPTIDLTGREDNVRPQARRDLPKPTAKRSVQNSKSLADKWDLNISALRGIPMGSGAAGKSPVNVASSTSPAKTSPVKIPQIEPRKRKLVRGNGQVHKPREPTPPPVRKVPEPKLVPRAVQSSDEEDAGDTAESDADEIDLRGSEETELQKKILSFVNEASVADLRDMSSQSDEVIDLVMSSRPFATCRAIEDLIIESKSTTKKGNTRTAKKPVGQRLVDVLESMMIGYDAVDELVKKCELLGRRITDGMKQWGVDAFGKSSSSEELSLVNLDAIDKDSGIGTPIGSTSGNDDDGSMPKRAKFLHQPSNMDRRKVVMKDYQIVGLNWLTLVHQQGLSGILADDMGLGKTCQVISFLAHLLESGEAGPHLIIVPGSTIENWMRELQTFCPSLKFIPYHGSQKDRFAQQDDILDAIANKDINLIVTTYDMTKRKEDNKFLQHCQPTVCVYDEGHMLKNASSDRYRQLMRIKADCRVLLTGTPLQNNLQELISLLAFIMPDIFAERRDELDAIFKQRATTTGGHDALLSQKRIMRARSMMAPFILRRKKHQVLKHLPQKHIRVEHCIMSERQRKIYDRERAKAHELLLGNTSSSKEGEGKKRKTGNQPAEKTSNVLVYLRQAAIHPLLFRDLYSDNDLKKLGASTVKIPEFAERNGNDPQYIIEDMSVMTDREIDRFVREHGPLRKFALDDNKIDEWLIKDSGKVEALLRVIKSFGPTDRALVFSQFTKAMDVLEHVFEHESITYSRLDGSTKISERQDLIDQFNNDDSIRVFMLSTKAGGQGINLAAANKVIIFDMSYNPQEDVQAENRAHRVGQQRDVEVIRLVTKGTIEEDILRLGQSKLALDARVAGEDGDDSSKVEQEGVNLVQNMLKKQLAGSDYGDATDSHEVSDVDVSKPLNGERDMKEDFLDGLRSKGLDVSA